MRSPRGDFILLASDTESGMRLDSIVASRIPDISRSQAAQLISIKQIWVNGTIKKSGYRVKSGDEITVHIPPPLPPSFGPEPIAIDILFEDEHLLVVNKQPGLVVHPGPGHHTGTLVNGLIYYYPDLEGVGAERRPGIVHRLDRYTSGALIVAKNTAAHRKLSYQFKTRKIHKTYMALVWGDVKSEFGTVSHPIGRHPVDRKRMSTKSHKGRTAETKWKVRERFQGATLLEVYLKTGRTHQIRVHCAAINHPILGDAIYGGKIRKKYGASTANAINSAPRQMLHAWRLEFAHPVLEKNLAVEAPLPDDMVALLESLRNLTNPNFS